MTQMSEMSKINSPILTSKGVKKFSSLLLCPALDATEQQQHKSSKNTLRVLDIRFKPLSREPQKLDSTQIVVVSSAHAQYSAQVPD